MSLIMMVYIRLNLCEIDVTYFLNSHMKLLVHIEMLSTFLKSTQNSFQILSDQIRTNK